MEKLVEIAVHKPHKFKLTIFSILFSTLLILPMAIPSVKATSLGPYMARHGDPTYTVTYTEGRGTRNWYIVSYSYSLAYISVTWPDYATLASRWIAGTVYVERAFNRLTGDLTLTMTISCTVGPCAGRSGTWSAKVGNYYDQIANQLARYWYNAVYYDRYGMALLEWAMKLAYANRIIAMYAAAGAIAAAVIDIAPYIPFVLLG